MCERMKDALERIRAIATGEEAVVGEEQDFEGEQVALAEIGKIAAAALATPAPAATQRWEPSTRDWVQDFKYENGKYLCKCVTCGFPFMGHKRRVECQLCASTSSAPSSPQPTPARAVRWWTQSGFRWRFDGKCVFVNSDFSADESYTQDPNDFVKHGCTEITDPREIEKLEAEFAARQ